MHGPLVEHASSELRAAVCPPRKPGEGLRHATSERSWWAEQADKRRRFWRCCVAVIAGKDRMGTGVRGTVQSDESDIRLAGLLHSLVRSQMG